MLLLGRVIKSNCGCGHSLQVDCVGDVVVVIHFSFCYAWNTYALKNEIKLQCLDWFEIIQVIFIS